MAFYRDLFTGEWKERPASEDGRQILYREEIPEHLQQQRSASPWSRTWASNTLAVPNEQAADFNEASRRAGTGAYYVPGRDGYAKLHCDTRGARKRELRHRGKVDRDGGYGD